MLGICIGNSHIGIFLQIICSLFRLWQWPDHEYVCAFNARFLLRFKLVVTRCYKLDDKPLLASYRADWLQSHLLAGTLGMTLMRAITISRPSAGSPRWAAWNWRAQTGCSRASSSRHKGNGSRAPAPEAPNTSAGFSSCLLAAHFPPRGHSARPQTLYSLPAVFSTSSTVAMGAVSSCCESCCTSFPAPAGRLLRSVSSFLFPAVRSRKSQSYEPLLLENEREAVADLLQYLESES